MDDKKYPGRFTIAFNLDDERQRAACEELRRHGRRKARFLADAILYYSQGQGAQAGAGVPVDDNLCGLVVPLDRASELYDRPKRFLTQFMVEFLVEYAVYL